MYLNPQIRYIRLQILHSRIDFRLPPIELPFHDLQFLHDLLHFRNPFVVIL
uniref:Uncharacterized protein n=1 Tax=Arundo donax TaxID=35708 RepID=A0A0A9BCD5_ARUDO